MQPLCTVGRMPGKEANELRVANWFHDTDIPYVVAKWRREHPGQDLPDGHVFTQPWPAGPAEQRRDQVISCQYRDGRARRTLRGTGEQVARAGKAVAGKSPVKRNRFMRLSGGTRSVNRTRLGATVDRSDDRV